MLQTLHFKFSGAPESVYIFETLGLEPVGRIGSGIAELIASVLLLVPKTVWAGALLALGIISGAIMSHLTKTRRRRIPVYFSLGGVCMFSNYTMV